MYVYIILMLLVFYIQCMACAFGKNIGVKLLPVIALVLVYSGSLIYVFADCGYNDDLMIWWLAMVIYSAGIPLADLLAWLIYGIIHVAQNIRK